MPFLPNIDCEVIRRQGATNVYGETEYSETRISMRCAIVSLNVGAQKTSVRTDSSASRGNAEEIVADARLLFPTLYEPQTGDRIAILEWVMEIVSVFPRYDVAGRLDHWQCDLNLAGE